MKTINQYNAYKYVRTIAIVAIMVMFSACNSPPPIDNTETTRADVVNEDLEASGKVSSEDHATTQQSPVVKAPDFLNEHAYEVPHDTATNNTLPKDQELERLAIFAWREFIALNWPSNYTESVPTRGTPDTAKTAVDFTQLGSAPLVWQTYKHRVEVYPQGLYDPSNNSHSYPGYQTSFDTVPFYRYRKGVNSTPVIPQCGEYDPNTMTWATVDGTDLSKVTLLNNLDETTEINLATMFVDGNPNAPGSKPTRGTPIWMNLATQPRRFIYQAKANRSMFDYVVNNQYYNQDVRMPAQQRTYQAVRNSGQGGLSACPQTVTADSQICFPHGNNNTDEEGNILIKATWRELTQEEATSGRFVTAEVIRYRNAKPNSSPGIGGSLPICYEVIPAVPTDNTLPYGLAGLHIIHKTVNYPTYVFATFEQVDNLDQSKENNQLFYYNRNDGVINPAKQVITKRAHPISSAVENINDEVHRQIQDLLKANHLDESVWLYYKLVGIQGHAVDAGIDENFFLANIVTETNEVLRSFSGTLNTDTGTINPTQLNIHKGLTSYVGGGCKGCHGNAQVGPDPASTNDPLQKISSDFSFITQGAPITTPDAINQPLLKKNDPDA